MIRVERLGKTYGRVRALADIDLEVARGDVFCLFGTNGSGRTTLLRILATLVKPTSGRVELGGVDLVRHPARARARMGYAGPSPFWPEAMTVREYVEFVVTSRGLRGTDRAATIDRTLARAEAPADAGVRDLSDGLAQRLALATALLHAPEVALLDEPLAHLDALGQREVRRWVAELRQNGSAVVIAANTLGDGLDLWNRGAVLYRGRVVQRLESPDAGASLADLLSALWQAHGAHSDE